MELGKLIRYHRKQAGLTQKQLADLAGLGKTVIFDVEKDKQSVRWNTLMKIFTVLNIKIHFESPLMEFYKEENHAKSSR